MIAEPRRARMPAVARILIAMALGAIAGTLLGERAAGWKRASDVVIEMIKALAAPLLFFAIVDAFLRTHIRARSGAMMMGISAINATIALVVGLTLSGGLRAGEHFSATIAPDPEAIRTFSAYSKSEVRVFEAIAAYIPTNVVRPFVDNAIIPIILLAVLGGAALRRTKTEQEARGESDFRVVESFVSTAYRAVEVLLGWVIVLIPIAVFAAVADSVGRYGFGVVRGLAVYVGVVTLGLAIQVFVVYQAWIVLVARMPLGRFWSGAREAIVYAIGAASSLATLPVTLRCLDRMGVSPQSARLAACVGTNFNNDGILLYEAMAVLFVAQAMGLPLTVGQQFAAVVVCVIAGLGISGVPDAGLVSLTIVLATVKLPITLVPVLLTVDWLIGRMRAVTNVTSDILVAVLLDRLSPPEGAAPKAALGHDPDGI